MTKAKTGKQKLAKLTGSEDFDGLSLATEALPASCYIDPAWHQHELQRIFYRHWIYLCHASTLTQARSYRRFQIGKQDIFLVRDDNAELRGFYNTCRHRGSILCQEQAGKFSGKLILCPYHQWAYGFDGQLIATTSHAEAIDFDKSDYPLLPISVKQWRGGIFVSLAEDPPNLDQSFERGVLMPEEHYVKGFQDWVRQQTGA